MSPTPHAPPAKPLPKAWPVDRADPITITLTANAGVMVAYRGLKCLVDGLHAGGGGYSAVPPEVLGTIYCGAPPFDNISYLFFTHLHPDHFGKAQVARFLEHWPKTEVRLPVPEGKTLGDASTVSARLFEMPHTGGEEMLHNCILFSLGGRRLLFLGDAVTDPARFSRSLGGAVVDAVVCNPLFLSRPEGRKTLLEGICPRRVIVNHIPFEADDKMRNREVVARAINRHQAELPPVTVLWDPIDSVTF